MADNTLIVAKMAPASRDEVARLFAESDATDLPHRIGVVRRRLFEYQGLYFHLVEFDRETAQAMATARTLPAFRQLSDALAAHVVPYAPATWRSPADAMATQFYEYRRSTSLVEVPR